MSAEIRNKDLVLLRRNRLLRILLFVTVLLMIVSVFTGIQREKVFDKERTAALDIDRTVWMNQGERNPHSAAHFSRYAFRPASPLALIDTGISDFAGMAIWMEAHFQDPAVFRRAEDGGELSRYLQLTPAFIVLTVVPLLVFLTLFSSIAGEREDRTLRQLLVSGVNAGQVFGGKIGSGLLVALAGFAVIFLPASLLTLLVTPAAVGVDAIVRIACLVLVFVAYISTFVAIAIGVSALFRTRQSAFLALIGLWTSMVVVVPQLGTDVSTSLFPQPDARAATLELRAASDVYYKDTDQRAQIEREVLERYGVDSIEKLPIDYGAYILQISEDLSEPLFDAFYSGLDGLFDQQELVMHLFSLITPTVAANSLSQGISGTDRKHQRAFASAAETHRRKMVQMLNEDYMYNASGRSYSYTADAALWEKFEDLDHEIPPFKDVVGDYLTQGLVLLVWLLAATSFAFWSVRRAVHGEEAAV